MCPGADISAAWFEQGYVAGDQAAIGHLPQTGSMTQNPDRQNPDRWARLRAVLAETAQAKALPNEAYVDPDFLAYERARLFEAGWACIGFGKDVPHPGDVVPRSLLGLPLILLRNAEGGIRVFH